MSAIVDELDVGVGKARRGPSSGLAYALPDAKLVATMGVSIHLTAGMPHLTTGVARGLDIGSRSDPENG
jgi:hypothetical protein